MLARHPLPASEVQTALSVLRARLTAVNRAWSVENYEALLRFFVDITPRLLDAERCGVFVIDPRTDRILSKVGTGIGEWEIEAPRDGSVVGKVVSDGVPAIENDLSVIGGFHRTVQARTGYETRNLACAPIRSVVGERVLGAIQVLNKRGGSDFTEADLALLCECASHLAMALDHIMVNAELRSVSSELDRNLARPGGPLGDAPFVAESQGMRKVIEMVHLVSATPVDVVIQGENGTGKELIARMIHMRGERRDRPFVAVNCAAVPETLAESEFFGYEKGAFTGADAARRGRFEEASGGSLFLDEVGEMPLAMQPKFLRAIQEGEGSRLGSNRVERYDLRLISASNRDLRRAVADGSFREDLFYRLFAVEIVVPPLRERRDDIAPLALAFLEDVCRRFDRAVPGMSSDLIGLFESYHWPGNVRQLRREVERLVALTPEGHPLGPERCSPEVRAPLIAPDSADDAPLPDQIRALETRLIRRALESTGGNKLKAAGLLGITRQGLHKKLKRLDEA